MTKVVEKHEDVPINAKLGATLSVKRHGGWLSSYEMAVKLAGWDK